MEIAGHEWISDDGKFIYFDLQRPIGVTFFVCGHNTETGKETKYELQRDEWSVHYTPSPDRKLFAGNGVLHLRSLIRKMGNGYICSRPKEII